MDYLFDERDAEAQLQADQILAEKAALQAKLRGSSGSSDIISTSERKPKRPPNLRPDPKRQATPDIFDDGESESASGLFEILQEMPTTETNDKGTLVYVRDMSLPKHWSGRTPKVLLSETVAKLDRYAIISYQTISGSSRAKRASVIIRWEGQKLDQWSMEEVACHDVTQAEQYIATIALFALTFPTTLGFAGSSLTIGSQTFFRLLPAVYRDLWDELATKRKRDDDATNRAVWSKLRSLVEPKLDVNNKVSGA
jgi:ATP-dependent RNA helicase DHX29